MLIDQVKVIEPQASILPAIPGSITVLISMRVPLYVLQVLPLFALHDAVAPPFAPTHDQYQVLLLAIDELA